MFSIVALIASLMLATVSAQPSICEKWLAGTSFKNQSDMVTAVVVGTFMAIIKDPVGKTFFDGTVPCMSRDFITNSTNTGALVTKLVGFFGGALGCKEAGYPAYTGSTDMDAVHKNMPITKAVFDLFITSLVNVVKGAVNATTVTTLNDDLGLVGNLLSDETNGKTCNQADCVTKAKGTYVAKTCGTAAAPATTTVAAGTACADDACCKKLEDVKPACSGCLKNTGCVYFGLFNNNLFTAGGKCVSTATATAANNTMTGYKKVDAEKDCADRCQGLACSACIGAKGVTGCVWCDTAKTAGDKVGVNLGSTGSCENEKCSTSVTPQTACPSTASTALLSMAIIVAVAASLLF